MRRRWEQLTGRRKRTADGPDRLLAPCDLQTRPPLAISKAIVDPLLIQEQDDYVRARQRRRKVERGCARAGRVHGIWRHGSVIEQKGDGVTWGRGVNSHRGRRMWRPMCILTGRASDGQMESGRAEVDVARVA